MAGFVIAFGLLGLLYVQNQPAAYKASAGVVVFDARATQLFGDAQLTNAARYVADQVAILESRQVAERASALAPTLDPPAEITADELLENSAIASSEDNNFIRIDFSADDPRTAQTGANAIAHGYQDVIGAALAVGSERALERLDESIDSVRAEIRGLQDAISALRPDDAERDLLDEQLVQIAAELAALRAEGSPADGSAPASPEQVARTEAITAKAEQLVAEIQARLFLSDAEARLPETALLLRQQEDALTLLGALTLRRTQVEVDAELASNGVSTFSSAGPGQSQTIGTMTAVAVSMVLGGLIGGGVAYWLSERRRRFGGRLEPQAVLGVPLLAEIPSRELSEPDSSGLVVETAPSSPAAESFRVLLGALQQQLKQRRTALAAAGSVDAASQGVVVAITSPRLHDGKTLVAANLAVAAARGSLKVLLVDGDLDGQYASAMVSGLDLRHDYGLTDAVKGLPAHSAVVPVEPVAGVRLDILGRGRAHTSASDVFGLPRVSEVFDQLRRQYDIVILDLPPLLDVAYASIALQHADFALVVAKHRSNVAGMEEARYRLDLIGVPSLGYVYVTGPVRRMASTNALADRVVGAVARDG